ITPTITSTQIIVPAIGGAGGGSGSIKFVANQVQLPPTPSGDFQNVTNNSGDGFITSTAGPNYHTTNDLPTFSQVATGGTVQVLNYSTKALVIGNTSVLNQGPASGLVDINVKSDNTSTPFHFKVGAAVLPTLVDIENRSTTGTPSITLTGLIDNPI